MKKKKKEKREWLDFRKLSAYFKGRKCIMVLHKKCDDMTVTQKVFTVGTSKLIHAEQRDFVRVFDKRNKNWYFTIGRKKFEDLATFSHITFSYFLGGDKWEKGQHIATQWMNGALFIIGTEDEYQDTLDRCTFGYFWTDKKQEPYRGHEFGIGEWLRKWENEKLTKNKRYGKD